MNKNFKTGISLVLLSFLLLGIISCEESTDPADDDIIVIGVILPYDNYNGRYRENAIRTGIDIINTTGGVLNGKTIKLAVRNSYGADRSVSAANAARDILNSYNNVVGFITAYSSSSLGITNDVSEPEEIPCISGSSLSDTLTGISPFYHRLVLPDIYQAQILADRAERIGIQKVGIAMQVQDLFSNQLATAFRKEFSGEVSIVEFGYADQDYEASMNALMSNDPDAVFLSMLNALLAAEFFNAFDYFVDSGKISSTFFLLSDALYNFDIFQGRAEIIVGEINGWNKNFGAIPSPEPSNPIYEDFAQKLSDAYEQDVHSYNAQFYDIAFIYALAIEKAGQAVSFNNIKEFRKAVNDNIRVISRPDEGDTEVDPTMGWKQMKEIAANSTLDYKGASGECDIDENGNTLTTFLVFTAFIDSTRYGFQPLEYLYP